MESVLKQRIITGILLVAGVFLGVILLPNTVFSVAALIVVISLAGWEWARLVKLNGLSRGLYIVGLLAVAYLAYYFEPLRWVLMVIGFLWWLIALVLLAMYEQDSKLYHDNRWLLGAAAFCVLVPAWLALITLHQYFPTLVLYLILLVAIADSGAYFSGKAFGKHKLAPALSPGKTREGVIGGLAGVAIWAILGKIYFNIPTADAVYFVLLSIIVALVSVAGDLFESMIKREAGMKDSGNILPGHGGILDRIDGLLAALPIFALGIFWGGINAAL